MVDKQRKRLHLLVSIGAYASGLVVLGAVDIGTVIEGTVSSSHWSASSLVLKVPVKAGEGSMLLTFVLEKEGTLFHSELFEIPESRETRVNKTSMAWPSPSNQVITCNERLVRSEDSSSSS